MPERSSFFQGVAGAVAVDIPSTWFCASYQRASVRDPRGKSDLNAERKRNSLSILEGSLTQRSLTLSRLQACFTMKDEFAVVILKTSAETPPLKDSMEGLGDGILWVEKRYSERLEEFNSSTYHPFL